MGWVFNPFTGQLDKVGSGSGVTPLSNFSLNVAAGATETIYSDDFSIFSGSKIFFSASNSANGKYKTFDFTVARDGSDLKDVVHRVGNFDAAISILINGANIELVVTNNESFVATIQGYRLNF